MVNKRMNLTLYVSLDELMILKDSVNNYIEELEERVDDKSDGNDTQTKVDKLMAARAAKCKLDISFH
jgi:DNA-binding transcriptional regulator/RsmH inhibitor MraZ